MGRRQWTSRARRRAKGTGKTSSRRSAGWKDQPCMGDESKEIVAILELRGNQQFEAYLEINRLAEEISSNPLNSWLLQMSFIACYTVFVFIV